MIKLEPYFAEYIDVTAIAPDDVVEQVFDARDSVEYSVFDQAKRGRPNFKCHWDVDLDALVSYQIGADYDGEYFEYWLPGVKVTLWPAPKDDLMQEVPNLEPAFVVFLDPHWDDLDEDTFSAYVRADYLNTTEGKRLGTSLLRAKLALADDEDDD